MITKIAQLFSAYLAKNGGAKEKQQIYAYGTECILNELISDVLLFICGLFMHQLMPLFIWCISFTFIRIHMGGFHASTHGRCIFIGTILGIISIYINQLWQYYFPYPVILLIIISLIISFEFAPVVQEKHPISKQRRKTARKLCLFFVSIEGSFVLFSFPYFPTYVAPIITGILTASVMAGIQLLIYLSHNLTINHIIK